ncbi:TPA: carbamoyl phosphate synthase large subunit [Patescibacteria group bacterium]|uniref:Carbamoyl phosphate synthase arginine-specific large chain n=1 Tax=Candidatus Gottesmanbacteria bacterium GW2011_GWA1_43_11 TaxID=1618436 RepID=A0A0G1CG38_9BACT|nr:MAG: Carbamoyl-phosphate synthase, large subunit [Candidatus Gottesmanbacteria bacterium GW2011_GWA1_43_11]HCS79518.1 carbamoyl phosphate synthase large subunit [Patescibacteria group bacterium]
MKHIHKVLLLGSGALKIGEAGEFDYSGSQAIKALKEEGIKVILVNPNIATIQTSEGLADEIYLLPVTHEFVSSVIVKERPDGILLSFGGQTALNCGLELARRGIFKKYDVKVLGTSIAAIEITEDRKLFSEKLTAQKLKTAPGKIVHSLAEAEVFANSTGFPLMLRTGFALGGMGSGIITGKRDLRLRVAHGLTLYPQLLLEECLSGWKEVEYEVVRDCDDNCITVCNMENFDPTGIHTGESIVVAPSQTLNNHEYFFLRTIAIQVIRAIGVVGECNIQFALNPDNGEYRIIEVNARLSRSSALASKATGYPLAYVAAKLALGKRLWEIPNSITGKTTAFFEPALDYIVIKVPRWDIDKFIRAESTIGSEMKSVGEVMSIGRTFEEAIQKASRMLNDGYAGVMDKNFTRETKQQLLKRLKTADTMRLFTVCSAIREGVTLAEIHRLTQIDHWFLQKLENIVTTYKQLEQTVRLTRDLLRTAKQQGFSDSQIADLTHSNEAAVRTKRQQLQITPFVKCIDTTAGEFPATTNYLYLTYYADESDYVPIAGNKAIVLGGGPYAIGTSVEFDWCAVNTVMTLRKEKIKGIMVNCNPETVSTDYDISDVLYFEELSLERVLDIYELEQAPLILSVGGQIPNNLSVKLPRSVPILGPTRKQITQAEDREQFSHLLDTLSIAQPAWGKAATIAEAKKLCAAIGYPALLRPSFVLSGKAMRVLDTEVQLVKYMQYYAQLLKTHPVLITRFLEDYGECDFDGVARSGDILVSAISEHIEGAGVHSGDSAMIHPPATMTFETQQEVSRIAARIIKALHLTGPFNIQFLHNRDVLVIECNLRASRSFPFVSKLDGVNFIEVATRTILGKKVPRFPVPLLPFYGVKVPQFSHHKVKGADPVLKVEMNSTGEVAALGADCYAAYLTALIATGFNSPTRRAAMVTLGGERGKLALINSCRKLNNLGFTLYATSGTHMFLKYNGIHSEVIGKVFEHDQRTVINLLQEKKIDFIINLPERGEYQSTSAKTLSDGYNIRRAAIDYKVPVFTNREAADFFVDAIAKWHGDALPQLSLQAYKKLTVVTKGAR